jgi:hypothetical protein
MRAGNGRIFDCLLSHKEDPTMSDGCKSQLRRRQKLASENYKVNRGLAKACKVKFRKSISHCQQKIYLSKVAQSADHVIFERSKANKLCIKNGVDDFCPPPPYPPTKL